MLGSDLTGCDGVIITHGTDTLPYASAAISFGLCHIPIPVVLVSSDATLEDPDANGLDNLRDAVLLIAQGIGPGVFVTYRNPDGRHLVHWGARLTVATPMDHYFRSIGQSEFGEFVGADLRLLSHERPAAPEYRLASAFRRASGSVMLIHSYPGLNYSALSLAGVRAIVHDLYHSGTACVSPGREDFSLVHLARRCSEAGVPLFVVPWPSTTDLYESSRDLFDVGVVTIARMAAGAAYTKVMWGLAAGLEGMELTAFVAEQELAAEFVSIA